MATMKTTGKSSGSKQGATHSEPQPDTGYKGTPTTSINMGESGEDKPEAHYSEGEASVAEIDAGRVTTRTGAGGEGVDPDGDADLVDGKEEDEAPADGGEDGADADADVGDEGEGGNEEEEDSKDSGPEDLGEYDADSEEVVSKFDEAYTNEDGALSLDRLSEEWFGNAARNEDDPTDGSLNEGTYKYLEDRFGLTKEAVKDIEAGQKAQHQQAMNQLYEQAGSQERLNAAITWGSGGGYSEAQRERFNTAMSSGDPAQVADAVDALMSRFDKANPDSKPRPQKGRTRRRAKPVRDVSNSGKTASVSGYESYEEYQKEARAARKAGDNETMKQVRRKLQNSAFFRSK